MEQNLNVAVLHAAFNAWNAGATLRKSRLRNKRFAYGNQWDDVSIDESGKPVTDWQRYSNNGASPVTNNLIRSLVRTIVGRYRSQIIDQEHNKSLNEIAQANELDELDSRALEEFLVAGCCVQRVDLRHELGSNHITVENVNPNHFFVNALADVRSWDCEIVGQLHDLSLARLLQRVARGSRRKAQWVRRLYTEGAEQRVQSFAQSIGADSHSATDFWRVREPGKCRAIEVWTLESREVALCHNRRTAQLTVESPHAARRYKSNADVDVTWDISTTWHCRWFSPMGDLLAEWDSPYKHGGHPFAMKFYPLTDGEVHSFVEGIIDQQKHVNRMITMLDQILSSCAKGVLLYPETALPDGFTWRDVRRVWSSTGGILPYSPHAGNEKPEQISANATDIGGFEMIKLQMQLLEEVSGVTGALQGKSPAGVNSAHLYETQTQNANLAIADIYGTFTNFRHNRDRLLSKIA